MRERALRFADADRERTALGLAGFHQEFAEEMRFPRTASAEHAFIARRLQQRLKDFCCRNFQDGQRCAQCGGSMDAASGLQLHKIIVT